MYFCTRVTREQARRRRLVQNWLGLARLTSPVRAVARFGHYSIRQVAELPQIDEICGRRDLWSTTPSVQQKVIQLVPNSSPSSYLFGAIGYVFLGFSDYCEPNCFCQADSSFSGCWQSLLPCMCAGSRNRRPKLCEKIDRVSLTIQMPYFYLQ